VERSIVHNYRRLNFVGTPEVVRQGIETLVEETGADEVMVTSTIYDAAERLRSFQLLAEAFHLPERGGAAAGRG
jgi:alkanesulfonate monooxygenase SsuD/methylene tetrahydromethanopterin reductase-like flavin-dependent oxidoreductase (luciferase family)